MANQWFKFYGGEYLSDPKIERLNPIERSCWLTILCMASMGTDGVIEFLTIESLLNRSGIQFDPYNPEDWEKALGVLVKFQNLKMIDCEVDGRITVKNWERRQEHNLSVAERVAKSRAKHKNVTNDVTYVTSEENRIEENRVDNKSTYGEFENVKLTIDEYKKLIEKIGEKNTNIIIEELSSYIASKGKRYSSHYATLLNWARRKYQESQKSAITKPKRTIA